MTDILSALIFGFTLAISVGPIALIIIQNGISSGFKASGRSAVGAALGDFAYAILAFLAGSALINYLASYTEEIKILSSAVLLVFGLYLITTAMLTKILEDNIAASKPVGLRGTFLLTILNPLTIIGFVAYIGQSSGAGSLVKLLGMSIAIFVGSLAAQMIFAISGARLKPYLMKKGLVTAIKVLSGLGVASFAIFGFTT